MCPLTKLLRSVAGADPGQIQEVDDSQGSDDNAGVLFKISCIFLIIKLDFSASYLPICFY